LKILLATSAEDGSDDPVKSWKETCKVLESSVDGLVEDAIERGVSLVLEGVSIYPSRKWVDKFTEAGGTACGVLLVVSKEETHKNLLLKRGFMTGNTGAEQKKLKSFDRVRLIQDEMISAAKDSGWVIIEQRVDPDPLDVVADALFQNASCMMKDQMLDELEEDCVLNNTNGKTAINDLVKAEKAALAAAVADEAKEEIEI
jgi:2-phosphoglycerate kinase